MGEPTASELASDLYDVAVAAAAAHGRKFKLSAAGGLKELTRAAAEEVLSPKLFGSRSVQEATLSLDERKDSARTAVLLLLMPWQRTQ